MPSPVIAKTPTIHARATRSVASPPRPLGPFNCASGLLPFHEIQKFGTGPRVAPERAEHAGRDHLAAGRLDAPHLHAEMARLDHDADTPGRQDGAQRLGDLPGQLLLDLQPVREDLDEPRDLAEPDHLALGEVTHMDTPEEG